jgi:hypothetical protein
MNMKELKNAVLQGKWFMSQHARIKAGKRKIGDADVIMAIINGEIIEDYSDDPRGHSCLVLGHTGENRSIHIVCSLNDEDFLIIITVYEPELPGWKNERTRKEGDDDA